MVDVVTEKTRRKHCFKIDTPGRTYIISAEDDDQMNSWVDEIRKLVKKRTNSTSGGNFK